MCPWFNGLIWLRICVCGFVCVCVHGYICVCVCACVCGGLRLLWFTYVCTCAWLFRIRLNTASEIVKLYMLCYPEHELTVRLQAEGADGDLVEVKPLISHSFRVKVHQSIM